MPDVWPPGLGRNKPAIWAPVHCLSPSTQVRQGTGRIFKDDSSQKRTVAGTSLLVQWLRLYAPSMRGLGSIPGWGTRSHMPQLKMLHIYDSVQPKKQTNKKQARIKQVPYCSYFNGIFYWSQEIGKGLYCLNPTSGPEKGLSSGQTQLERLRWAAQKTRGHSGSNCDSWPLFLLSYFPTSPSTSFFSIKKTFKGREKRTQSDEGTAVHCTSRSSEADSQSTEQTGVKMPHRGMSGPSAETRGGGGGPEVTGLTLRPHPASSLGVCRRSWGCSNKWPPTGGLKEKPILSQFQRPEVHTPKPWESCSRPPSRFCRAGGPRQSLSWGCTGLCLHLPVASSRVCVSPCLPLIKTSLDSGHPKPEWSHVKIFNYIYKNPSSQ